LVHAVENWLAWALNLAIVRYKNCGVHIMQNLWCARGLSKTLVPTSN
jgi:hypothetical protein